MKEMRTETESRDVESSLEFWRPYPSLTAKNAMLQHFASQLSLLNLPFHFFLFPVLSDPLLR